jgi:hypothetical protein
MNNISNKTYEQAERERERAKMKIDELNLNDIF